MTGKIVCRTDHIFRMTDGTGMFQHAVGAVPDLAEGYTADDNARALIAASLLWERERRPVYAALLCRYTAFLYNAQNPDGTFRNFMGCDRRFAEQTGSEDCFGRCLWAVCRLLSRPSTPEGLRVALRGMLARALPRCGALHYPRAKAYAAAGLSLLPREESCRKALGRLGASLAETYRAGRAGDWHWFEDTVTYCNFALPRALLLASKVCGRPEWEAAGFESLRFLEEHTTENGCFHAVGCNGWLPRGGKPAAGDEQPVEAGGGVLAYLTAYRLRGDPHWLRQARVCLNWYFGANAGNRRMVDDATGGIYDGLCGKKVNRNEGAESLVCFWIALLTFAERGLRPRRAVPRHDAGKTEKRNAT